MLIDLTKPEHNNDLLRRRRKRVKAEWSIELIPVDKTVEAFDPDEERDDHGRWTSGGDNTLASHGWKVTKIGDGTTTLTHPEKGTTKIVGDATVPRTEYPMREDQKGVEARA